MSSSVRIRPGSPAEIGLVNTALTRVIGLATGGRPPNVFTTLARHRGLFRKWLVFAGGLMPGGTLARAETELLILDVARRMGSEYEWLHHERLGKKAGIDAAAIEHLRRGEIGAAIFSARERALLRASLELHEHRMIGDEAYAELARHASETEIIEVCMLVGHYQMLAQTLNTLRVELDPR